MPPVPPPPVITSKSQVNRAGDLLRDWFMDQTRSVGSLDTPEMQNAIWVMVRFRESFQAPLKKVTVGVRQFVQRETTHQIVVGQRLKRAPQIVYKLTRFPDMKLARMRDVGGCRAILGGGQAEVDRVLARIRRRWEIKGVKDYTKEPAPSGYRAIHVVVLRDGHLIEIQLRTPVQHQWAEAVERTDLRLRTGLKEGVAPAELLDYFRMAAEGLSLEERGVQVDDEFRDRFLALRQRVTPYFERRT